MKISPDQLFQIKQALKTKRARVLIALCIVFVTSIMLILNGAFNSIDANHFEDSFWIWATLELLLAGLAIAICFRFGNLGAAKMATPIQTILQKIFHH